MLRQSGEFGGGPAPFAKADRSRFLAKLDETVHAVRRRRRSELLEPDSSPDPPCHPAVDSPRPTGKDARMPEPAPRTERSRRAILRLGRSLPASPCGRDRGPPWPAWRRTRRASWATVSRKASRRRQQRDPDPGFAGVSQGFGEGLLHDAVGAGRLHVAFETAGELVPNSERDVQPCLFHQSQDERSERRGKPEVVEHRRPRSP